MNRVVVASTAKRLARLEGEVRRAALHTLAFLRKNNRMLEVVLADDAAMRVINKSSRGLDVPTNVLSFSAVPRLPHPETRLAPLGEVYLAPDYIARHREDRNKLLVHGILHLIGYDHTTNRDMITMQRREKQIQSRLF